MGIFEDAEELTPARISELNSRYGGFSVSYGCRDRCRNNCLRGWHCENLTRSDALEWTRAVDAKFLGIIEELNDAWMPLHSKNALWNFFIRRSLGDPQILFRDRIPSGDDDCIPTIICSQVRSYKKETPKWRRIGGPRVHFGRGVDPWDVNWHDSVRGLIDEIFQRIAREYLPNLRIPSDGLAGKLLDEDMYDLYQFTREELERKGKEKYIYDPKVHIPNATFADHKNWDPSSLK